MNAVEELRTFIESAVRGLSKFPEKVHIRDTGEPEGKTILFIINCEPADISLIIGRHGRNIKAIRELSWAMGAKNSIKATVVVNE